MIQPIEHRVELIVFTFYDHIKRKLQFYIVGRCPCQHIQIECASIILLQCHHIYLLESIHPLQSAMLFIAFIIQQISVKLFNLSIKD